MKLILLVLTLLFLFPEGAQAREADPVIWVIVFPTQYLLVIASLFIFRLGLIRKAFISSVFVLFHVAVFEFMILDKLPELVIALSPALTWIGLLLLAAVLKKNHILDSPSSDSSKSDS